MVFLQALGQIGDVLNWFNTIGVIVLIITFIRTNRRDGVSDVDKKIKEKTDTLEKNIEELKFKKANKEWVEVEIESIEKSNSDFKEEQNARYDAIKESIDLGNNINEQILKRIEQKVDQEILLNSEFRKLSADNHTKIEVLEERINH